jgi:hypothetical protein
MPFFHHEIESIFR